MGEETANFARPSSASKVILPNSPNSRRASVAPLYLYLRLFAPLQPREKEILSLRFYDGKTQMEVANALGISQAQVSRLEKGAIGAMRKSVSVS